MDTSNLILNFEIWSGFSGSAELLFLVMMPKKLLSGRIQKRGYFYTSATEIGKNWRINYLKKNNWIRWPKKCFAWEKSLRCSLSLSLTFVTERGFSLSRKPKVGERERAPIIFLLRFQSRFETQKLCHAKKFIVLN